MKPSGSSTVVGEAREARLPVGGQEAERVPALGLPGVRDLAALEDDVVDAAVGEDAADGEAGVPGPDDDDAGPARRAQLTVTVTFVGLVMTSKTAERFCDWATSASMSSGLASASIS